MLLSDVDTIVNAMCIHHRLQNFESWIVHTQGRANTFTAKDLLLIRNFRSSCRKVSTASPAFCAIEKRGLEPELKKFVGLGLTIDAVWPAFQSVNAFLDVQLGYELLCGGLDLARLISFFIPYHLKPSLDFYMGFFERGLDGLPGELCGSFRGEIFAIFI